jgi:hypothetical protein
MALGLYFQPTGFSTAVYEEALSQLEQAGAGFGQVPGRTFHCAMEVDGQISVFESGSRGSSSRNSGRRRYRS